MTNPNLIEKSYLKFRKKLNTCNHLTPIDVSYINQLRSGVDTILENEEQKSIFTNQVIKKYREYFNNYFIPIEHLQFWKEYRQNIQYLENVAECDIYRYKYNIVIDENLYQKISLDKLILHDINALSNTKLTSKNIGKIRIKEYIFNQNFEKILLDVDIKIILFIIDDLARWNENLLEKMYNTDVFDKVATRSGFHHISTHKDNRQITESDILEIQHFELPLPLVSL